MPPSPREISALWGPLHGGANQAVVEMLEQIHAEGGNYRRCVEMAKDSKNPFRLSGFGHRVYKTFDPRAQIIKKTCDELLNALKIDDPLLDIAKELEQIVSRDDYFIERNLYPNVDFYSGIIYRALGIPKKMFTVMFALGRLPGWIATGRSCGMTLIPVWAGPGRCMSDRWQDPLSPSRTALRRHDGQRPDVSLLESAAYGQ